MPYSPFPWAINPHVEAAQQHTLAWATDFALITPDGPQHRRFCKAKFAWLTALTHPTISQDDLELVTDWHTWLFSHDDICDASQVGWDPDRLAAMDEDLISVLLGGTRVNLKSPLACALNNICQRLLCRTNRNWVERFAWDVQRYFQGNYWEATNRRNNHVPDLATYTKMRLHTGAVFSCFDLIGITEEIDAHAAFFEYAYVQQLMVMANHHICWINDIFGLEKEMREGNMNNLVLVLQNQHQSSLQAAVDKAMAMCDAEIRAFLGLESRLIAFEGQQGDQLRCLINGMRAWMGGHINWYQETGRYQPKK
jgi:5-epi-alpha-selinene synthase